jgi:peptide/nickel transport system permease protein
VPTVTGLLLVDALLAGDWDAFASAANFIVLPGLLLGYHSVAYISRMTRSFMLEQLGQEYIVTARVKGLSRGTVVWRHTFRNIRVQLLTIVGLTFGSMLDGSVLLETVFAWPGLGQYLTRGLLYRDMNVVLGSVLVVGVVFVTVNAVSDILYRFLDPRTR